MLLSSLVALVVVLGGEFPAHNSFVGGAPINTTVSEKVPETVVGGVSAQAGALRHVENSGICGRSPLLNLLPTCMLTAHYTIETTPGVYSASGYADLTPTQHMWFWFFAARNNPDTAPLTIWLNGGVSRSGYSNRLVTIKFLISRSPEALL